MTRRGGKVKKKHVFNNSEMPKWKPAKTGKLSIKFPVLAVISRQDEPRTYTHTKCNYLNGFWLKRMWSKCWTWTLTRPGSREVKKKAIQIQRRTDFPSFIMIMITKWCIGRVYKAFVMFRKMLFSKFSFFVCGWIVNVVVVVVATTSVRCKFLMRFFFHSCVSIFYLFSFCMNDSEETTSYAMRRCAIYITKLWGSAAKRNGEANNKKVATKLYRTNAMSWAIVFISL